MINYQTITIDLQPDYREPVVQMYLSERDVGRPIQVNVLMQGQPYSFTAGTTVHIDLRKPSGHVVQVNGNYAVGSNVVLFNVVEQMAAEPGMCLTELSIVGDGQDPIGSKNWLTKVELSPLHAGDPSETWIEDLDELVQDAMEGHIDATLSIEGDAADAKAAGDAIAAAVEQIPAVDDTLTVSGDAADAAAVGEELTNLLSALYTDTNGDFTALDWQQGTISTTSGSMIPTNTTRICTNRNVVTNSVASVTAKPGYQFLVYAWADTTYLGVWNGTEFIKTSATGLSVVSQDLAPLRRAGATDIYIVGMHTTTTQDISPTDGTNFSYVNRQDNYTPEDEFQTLSQLVDSITDENNIFDSTNVDIRKLYIKATGTHEISTESNDRLVVIPIQNNTTYIVDLQYGASTKRIGTTTDYPANYVTVSNYAEYVGVIDHATVNNTTGNYLVIQLFINADTDQTASNYYSSLVVYNTLTAVDQYARRIAEEALASEKSFFFTENLTGLPILDSMSDVTVDSTTWDDSADFHAMVKTLCDNSDDYITQHLMGQDAHNNNLYYYRTHPTAIYYGCERESVAPAYPPTGGYTVKPFRLILTSNIHYREKNGNYVVYNLLSKMLSEESQMLKWFKNNTEIIWIPCCCPTSNEEDGYVNADGQNVNRSFPTTKEGTATCPEAALIKTVFDTFGEETDLHLDLHTFGTNANFCTWIFTDNKILGARGARVAEDVLQDYRAKYPYSQLPTQALQRSGGSFVNTPTTSSYYMEVVYGVPAGTIEIQREIGTSVMDFNTKVTNATAVFYDLVTQTVVGMAR